MSLTNLKYFPVLEKLEIRRCDKLKEIPDSFGDIASLELIEVWYSPQLKESTFKIKEYVEEMTGEDKLERIQILKNLKSLKLDGVRFSEWNMEDVTFQNLKYLTLDSVEFSEWQVDAEKSFPVLEKYVYNYWCNMT
ncbi:hypothetical protein H5410_064639, partial [Solanum commersonii]